MKSLESRQTTTIPSFHPAPITDTQVAHARLNKAGHRPLGRTQSAPLPLGHPMLNSSVPGQHLSVHYEDYELPLQPISTHYLKQVHFLDFEKYVLWFLINNFKKFSKFVTRF